MQIAKSQGNIVEKVIRNKDGKLIRARFFVYENAGRIKARLLDFTYIKELAHSVVFAISGNIKAIIVWSREFVSKAIAPFLNSETIYLSGSKPRAPTV
jgi:hypothetical protein